MKNYLFDQIKNTLYKDKLNINQIEKAYFFAKKRHEGQFREGTGEPYIIHPVNVAINLLAYDTTTEGICAALLHDTIEDTDTNIEEIQELFGNEVAFLVDGVTKIDHHDPHIMLKANKEKVFSFAEQDDRVIKLKIADAQHNLLTLDVVNPRRRRNIIFKTKVLHAEYAKKIGMYDVAEEFLRIASEHEKKTKHSDE